MGRGVFKWVLTRAGFDVIAVQVRVAWRHVARIQDLEASYTFFNTSLVPF